jgi:hypothetical protein
MGGILEVGKITTTVWLRKYWNRCGFLLKLYLVPAVIALALLTSMGIFGFLSKAHMEHGISTGDSQAKLSLYDEKIKTQRDNIELARKALTQMDNQVDQRLSRGDSENSAERAVQIRRQQSGERTKLQKEIGDAQKEIAKLNEERAPIAAENRKIEAEVGPIKYIAALIYGENADNNTLEAAVRWVIILLVIVFDPLAIALVLAANASKEWDKEDEEGDSPLGNETPSTPAVTEPAYEPDDGPLTSEQIEQIKATVDPTPPGWMFEKPDIINCYLCGTELVNAPGIGLFCPNKLCDISDEVVEEPKTILEQHPYLTKPFVHFDVKPMVATINEPVIEPVVEPVIEPVIEPTADQDHTIASMLVKQDLPYKELPGGYVAYKGKHMQKEAFLSMHPEFLKIAVDSGKQVNSSFGPKFPDSSEKGDVFTRVDVLPNKVYKFDGQNWIEISKTSSNTYLYNTKYLEYLIEMIDNGQYDPELLSDNERIQIEDYIKSKQVNDRNI